MFGHSLTIPRFHVQEGLTHQLRIDALGHRPPDDPATCQHQNRCQIQSAARWQERYVRHPRLIRCPTVKVSCQYVRRHRHLTYVRPGSGSDALECYIKSKRFDEHHEMIFLSYNHNVIISIDV